MIMKDIDLIKNRLIDNILATRNQLFLEALDKMFQAVQTNDLYSLSEEQTEMLLMSEEDIKGNNIISESELKKLDKQWLY